MGTAVNQPAIRTDYCQVRFHAWGLPVGDCVLRSHRPHGRCARHRKPLQNLCTLRQSRALQANEWSSALLSANKPQTVRLSGRDRTSLVASIEMSGGLTI